ncbi:hypothetical protein HDU97_009153 [Phlyctochytrium planicorne]|nr:hypothetical protein HDU97_009153 [Phlyctochytrium planicorne]
MLFPDLPAMMMDAYKASARWLRDNHHTVIPIAMSIALANSSIASALLFLWLSIYLIFIVLLDNVNVDDRSVPRGSTQKVLSSQLVDGASTRVPVPLTCYSRDCVAAELNKDDLLANCKSQQRSLYPCYSPTCPLRKGSVTGISSNSIIIPSAADAESSSLLSVPSLSPPSVNGHLLSTPKAVQDRANFHRLATFSSTNATGGPRRPPLKRRMSFMSEHFGHGIFGTEIPTTNVFGVMYLEELPNLQDLRAVLRKTMEDFPRLRSLYSLDPSDPKSGTAVWTILPVCNVDLDRLLVFKDVSSKDELCRHIEDNLNHFWDYSLPVWRCHVLRSTDPSLPSAIAFEFHHGIGDGLSLVRVALSIITAEGGKAYPSLAYMKKHPAGPKNVVELIKSGFELVGTFFQSLWAIVLIALWIGDTPTAVKSPHINHQWTSKRHLTKLPVVSLAAIKAIKTAYGATVNDVLVAAIAGAYRKYLAEQGDERFADPVDGVNKKGDGMVIRATCPFSFPRPMDGPGDLHNRFAIVSCPIPTNVPGAPSNRIQAVHAAMDRLKHTLEPIAQLLLQRFTMVVFGKAVVGKMALSFAARHTISVTNVPGPSETAFLCGKKVLAVDPVVTAPNAFWAIFSYAGGVNVNYNVDLRHYRNPERLSTLYMDELREMCREAKVDVELEHKI